MLIYKIMPKEEWQLAKKSGFFKGSAVDIKDGFIHFSKAEQLSETVNKHFQNIENLLIVVVDSEKLDQEELKFEISRGGALFPHLYGVLPLNSVVEVIEFSKNLLKNNDFLTK